MEEITHIVPVGHTKETLVQSLRRFPVSKVVLVLGNKPETDSEKKAREIAKQVKEELGSIPCEEIEVDGDDIPSAALTIIEKIKKEEGVKVIINLSGSLRSIGVAAYIAALVTESETYIGIPEYVNGKVIGVQKIVEVPIIPLIPFSAGKREILHALSKSELTLDELIKKLRPKIKKCSSEYAIEKSRLSHHITDLKEEHFIESTGGKNAKINLTKLGQIYTKKN